MIFIEYKRFIVRVKALMRAGFCDILESADVDTADRGYMRYP